VSQFTITIKGNDKSLTFLVEHLVNWQKFHRFLIKGKNGQITITKFNGQWKQESGRVPKTEPGKLSLGYIIRELESYLRNKKAG